MQCEGDATTTQTLFFNIPIIFADFQCLGWGKLCFSPWTEWTKIESVPLFNYLSPCYQSRLIQGKSISPRTDRNQF